MSGRVEGVKNKKRLVFEVEILIPEEEVERLEEARAFNARVSGEISPLHFEFGGPSRIVTVSQLEEDGPDCDPEAPCVFDPAFVCSVHADCDAVEERTYPVVRAYQGHVHRAYITNDEWLEATSDKWEPVE